MDVDKLHNLIWVYLFCCATSVHSRSYRASWSKKGRQQGRGPSLSPFSQGVSTCCSQGIFGQITNGRTPLVQPHATAECYTAPSVILQGAWSTGLLKLWDQLHLITRFLKRSPNQGTPTTERSRLYVTQPTFVNLNQSHHFKWRKQIEKSSQLVC